MKSQSHEVIVEIEMPCCSGVIGRKNKKSPIQMLLNDVPCEDHTLLIKTMSEQDPTVWADACLESEEVQCDHCPKWHTGWRLIEDVDSICVLLLHPQCLAWFCLNDDKLHLVMT